uniref:Uncharacterized protein n=1 Tax=Arundo donax TaxID=35708 RepID=A0A0A9EMA7_ARUDO
MEITEILTRQIFRTISGFLFLVGSRRIQVCPHNHKTPSHHLNPH